jgi:hypothetical protein
MRVTSGTRSDKQVTTGLTHVIKLRVLLPSSVAFGDTFSHKGRRFFAPPPCASKI